jgi:hypothetical protein
MTHIIGDDILAGYVATGLGAIFHCGTGQGQFELDQVGFFAAPLTIAMREYTML